MITMVDEIFDRDYQNGRAQLNAALAGLGRTLGDSLKALHRIEWSAPWASKKKTASRA